MGAKIKNNTVEPVILNRGKLWGRLRTLLCQINALYLHYEETIEEIKNSRRSGHFNLSRPTFLLITKEQKNLHQKYLKCTKY